ncbi:YdcF family protein [Ectobacillus antri]|uniref:YdcF family protein n=1 Tax=Ectobacillus antri TaxID=2486280 RepID=A0ABT6H7U2_9BACI|nr:YdcF family protein [Ectobacillus antri]MDG4658126.1 YdcF family protein [Ectobacillus antri]MDG5754928.1 YdcF family protein [Ectobacillus antri]
MRKFFFGLGTIGIFLLICVQKPFLIIQEKPARADVIIVLSGDQKRLEKAAALYEQGYAPYVLLSKSDTKRFSVEKAVKLGVPRERIIEEKHATSTYTNALYTKELLERRQFQTAIVVSSDYHMQRVRLVFERVYDKSYHFLYVPYEGKWWGDMRRTVVEYGKLFSYFIKLYKYIDL